MTNSPDIPLPARLGSPQIVILSAAKDPGPGPPMAEWRYYVYILANRHRTVYVGITNNVLRRLEEHRSRSSPGFTAKYGLGRLVYIEATSDVRSAIAREKQIKGWTRARKIALIESENPGWDDLSAEWWPHSTAGRTPSQYEDPGRDPSLRSG